MIDNAIVKRQILDRIPVLLSLIDASAASRHIGIRPTVDHSPADCVELFRQSRIQFQSHLTQRCFRLGPIHTADGWERVPFLPIAIQEQNVSYNRKFRNF